MEIKNIRGMRVKKEQGRWRSRMRESRVNWESFKVKWRGWDKVEDIWDSGVAAGADGICRGPSCVQPAWLSGSSLSPSCPSGPGTTWIYFPTLSFWLHIKRRHRLCSQIVNKTRVLLSFVLLALWFYASVLWECILYKCNLKMIPIADQGMFFGNFEINYITHS